MNDLLCGCIQYYKDEFKDYYRDKTRAYKQLKRFNNIPYYIQLYLIKN